MACFDLKGRFCLAFKNFLCKIAQKFCCIIWRRHLALFISGNVLAQSRIPGGVRTEIAKHHARYSKSDHLCEDGEECRSRRKRLRRRIFVKYAVEISDLPFSSVRDVYENKGYRIIGKKQCHSVNKCILFEITPMQWVYLFVEGRGSRVPCRRRG